MRLHRFYIKGKKLGKIEVSERLVLDTHEDEFLAGLFRQWKDVFRYITGNRVSVFDDSKVECTAMIESLSAFKAELVILERVKGSKNGSGVGAKGSGADSGAGEFGGSADANKNQVWLFASIIKNDNFDFVVQKSTELGADHIVPVVADRTIKKNIKVDRAQKIATEASEQSGRVTIPTVHEPVTLKKALQDFMAQGGDAVVCLEGGEEWIKLRPRLKKYPLGFVVGPEGGWSPAEKEYFLTSGFKMLSLGDTVLRAETAVVAVMALQKLG